MQRVISLDNVLAAVIEAAVAEKKTRNHRERDIPGGLARCRSKQIPVPRGRIFYATACLCRPSQFPLSDPLPYRQTTHAGPRPTPTCQTRPPNHSAAVQNSSQIHT